jgi:hypothetical protein
MRTKKDIATDGSKKEKLILEVLLDIRELMLKNQVKRKVRTTQPQVAQHQARKTE